METNLQYVSPEYEKQLQNLAETLVTPERYGRVALAEVIELPTRLKLIPTHLQ